MKRLLFFVGLNMFFLTNSNAQKSGCSSAIPKRSTSLDTSHMRGLADNYYLWNNGQNIYIKFLSGGADLQDKIKVVAKEWCKYANIKFVFIATGNSNVRINLDSKGGNNSLIGSLANSVDQNQKTMNLDTTGFEDVLIMKRVVLHEFGHVLGLLHEHFSPISGISWNKKVVYDDVKQNNDWDSLTTDQNIFQEYKISYTNGTLFDKFSIMEYPILSKWTTNGFSVDWNDELSVGDKSMISSLYPITGKRKNEVPRFQVKSINKIEVINSRIKEGLLIYPKFRISTFGKEGTVCFIVFFYYPDETPIKAKSEKYNIANNIATFKIITLPPNLQIQANNGKHDFELYIPYSVFPLSPGNNEVKVKFTVLLYDNSEIKLLSSSNPVNFVITK